MQVDTRQINPQLREYQFDKNVSNKKNNSYTTLNASGAAASNSSAGVYDTNVFTLVFAGLICVINELKADDFILKEVYIFPLLKRTSLSLERDFFQLKKCFQLKK